MKSLQGCYVKTPYGWGICAADEPDSLHLQVGLDWRIGGMSNGQAERTRVNCWVRRADISHRSFCAVGDCVLTSFGAGVLIEFRPEDDKHIVQLWGPLGKGRHRAFLNRSALLAIIPAAPGLSVETPYGPGKCRGYRYQEGSRQSKSDRGEASAPDLYLVDYPWGRATLNAASIKCPAAMTMPLINRFLDRAGDLLRLHFGTLARLADAFGGAGLERLQEQLASRAGEAVAAAAAIWEEWREREAMDVVDHLKKQADEAMTDPKIKNLLDAGIAQLNKLVCKAQGFDGCWIGKDDNEPRCTIEDAMIQWHWGESSELEIWGPDAVSTDLQGGVFRACLLSDGTLRWSDGDVWRRQGGGPIVTTLEEEDRLLEDAVGQLDIPFDLARLRRSLDELRSIVLSEEDQVSESKLDGEATDDLELALNALTRAARAATGNSDVKTLVSALETELQKQKEMFLEIQEQIMQSKAGRVLLQGQNRLSEKLAQLQETEITPQLENMEKRGRRFVTRLVTDKKVKNKAFELFSVVQNRFSESLGDTQSVGSLEAWVGTVRERAMRQLGMDRAALVEGLTGLHVQLQKGDLRQILTTASLEQTLVLEEQIEQSLLKAMSLSGINRFSGTDLLDRFESSNALANIPVVQQTSGTVLSLLLDLHIEVPAAVRQLLEAQASGRSQDAAAWHRALVNSLDDELIVKGASELVENSEMVLTRIQELKSSTAVAKVMQQLENEDMERELLKQIHNFNPQEVLENAEKALTNLEAREALVSQIKDTCLEFILKILPAIHIEKVEGNDNGCDWEINDINFSDFSFRKENVHITLGNPAIPTEELIRVSAWDITAHFRQLKVTVKQTSFPFLQAEGRADAKAERMSVGLAFKLKPAEDGKPPHIVLSSRSVHMENLELWVRETSYAMVVNALSFLFADVLKSYACQKITSQLDEHTAVLIDGINHIFATCTPLLSHLGISDPLQQLVAASADTGASLLAGIADDPSIVRRSIAEMAAEDLEPEPCIGAARSLKFAEHATFAGILPPDEIDWVDPGRSFAVRV